MEKRYICAFPTPSPPTLPVGLCDGAEVPLVAPLGPDLPRWLVAANTQMLATLRCSPPVAFK